MSSRSARGLTLATAIVATGGLLVAPSSAAASQCPAGGASFIESASDVVELEQGANHPNVTDHTDTITITHRAGTSSTWIDSTSAGVAVGHGGLGVSAQRESSNEIAYTLDRDEEHTFTVPAHTTMRVDYMIALGITRQGDQCRYDRVEATVVGKGYRVTTVDHRTGVEEERYDWPVMEHTSVPTF